MRIQLIVDKKGSIDRASIFALVEREIYLHPMTLDEFVDKIVWIIEEAGVQVTRKELPLGRKKDASRMGKR
jgi:hypothetical protein